MVVYHGYTQTMKLAWPHLLCSHGMQASSMNYFIRWRCQAGKELAQVEPQLFSELDSTAAETEAKTSTCFEGIGL